MNTVYWVRHGENQANITKEFSHRKVDYSLTEKGIVQSMQTAEYFKSKKIDFVYSSPLKRAYETAEIISKPHSIKIEVIEEFREINVGNLEGRPVTQANWNIHNDVLKQWSLGYIKYSFPDGENYIQLFERLKRGMHKAINGKENNSIIIVGHGGIFTNTILDLCPDTDRNIIESAYNHNCSVSEMTFKDNFLEGMLKYWAFSDHLYGEAAKLVESEMN
ncbi:MAG TPA: histidine phosphatase family protein [Victivallales bacterium]|nr:histidine phosphatase family protein [Victivallales bacterium]